MIYITGDTHGTDDPNGFLKLKNFAQENRNLTKNDYVIISGDAGIVWSDSTLDKMISQYSKLPFTILYIDGNHENFDMLEEYPVEIWNGGKVHKIDDSILHLMRGQVFTIEGKKILTFGGAESTDKDYRIEGKSWWSQEVPSSEEFNEAIDNLLKVDFKVDYIVTHTIDAITLSIPPMFGYNYRLDETSKMLNYFQNNVDYKHWYFGHFHEDIKVSSKKTLLYMDIIKLI